MANGTAQIGATALRGSARARGGRAAALARATGISRVEALVAVGCLALAGVTLLFPSTPTYDSWSWLVWGRQIVHGSLDTVEGPSWKPLPIFFTIPLSFFHSAAPDMWLVIARAAAMCSVLAAFALARRLVGGGAAGMFAGLFAAVALVYSQDYVRTVALGQSEGMLVLLLLLAIDRHVRGSYRQAFVLGFLTGLLRPEVWPFLGSYGLWLVWRDRSAWKLAAGLGAATVFLWLAPERWGSGNFFRAAERANDPTNPNALAFAADPFRAVLELAHQVVPAPVLTGLGLAAVAGLWSAYRGRRVELRLLVLAVWAVVWVFMVAAMTQIGFSGNPRYLMPPTGIACVAAGAGWGFWLRAAGRRRRPVPRGALVLAAAGVVAWWGVAEGRWLAFPALKSNLRYQAQLRDTVPAAIARAGGRQKIVQCGRISTNLYQVPMLAWYLHVPGEYLEGYWLPQGYMFQTRPNAPDDQPDPIPGPDNHYLGEVGTWSLYDGQCWGDVRKSS
jgi:hypothetical protein